MQALSATAFDEPIHRFCRREIPQAFSRRGVHQTHDPGEVFGGEGCEIRPRGQEPAQPAIHVLDRSLLPRRAGIAEPHIHTATRDQRLIMEEFRATIEGEGLPESLRCLGRVDKMSIRSF